ncbi:MAG TPA: ATP-dependent zinc metalloprotease FtsH [Candidatus Scatomorpha pullicola]|nr:ATP-dependent zinc metalloprotease FtsH [Candidatus Scatomorpha pullicola]
MIILLAVIYTMLTPRQEQEALSYADVVEMFQNEKVESFVVEGGNLIITRKGAAETDPAVTYDLYDVGMFWNQLGDLIQQQKDAGIISDYDFQTGYVAPWWVSMIPYLLIIVAFFALWYYMMNKAGGGGGAPGVGKFGKARTRLGSEEQKKVTFKDVAGCEEEKAELEEVVNFLKNPKAYTDMGARIPKGVLLVGPPGTGKTLLAKAVAGEAGVQFLSISGSDFVELYVGVGASRVRDLFDQAKKVAPAIIFIDEIDAVGRQRGSGLGGGHDEREQTLNQLLVEMDGFSNNEGVIVMAATNRDDILDNALTRPGRFDRRVYIGLPDIRGREAILRVHAKGKPLADDVNLNSVARGTPGFSGADLENLLNEAALMAVSNGKRFITSYEIEEAIRKVEMGPEKKSKVMSERARKLTAYHEGGHAVVSEFLDHTDPVHYITIIPRGPSGGATYFRPKEDLENFHSYSELFEDIVVSLGGRVSERLFLDDISTGASGDIQQATNLARAMVTQFGMSERLGPISYDSSGHSIFIGRDFGTTKSYSEETAAIIDEEVKRIFDEANAKCVSILREHADVLKGVAEYLLQNESMDGEDFSYFCRHGELPPKKPEPKMRDSSIEPPARKISYTFDEPKETPQIESGDAQTQAEPKDENKE